MGIFFNRPQQKRIRQHLRNNASDAERKLWGLLKGSQLRGYKFRRQQGIGRYVVDFYCPTRKLAIEVDGATHGTVREQRKDHERQVFIEAAGICVLRFTNDDIYTNTDGVLHTILAALKKSADE